MNFPLAIVLMTHCLMNYYHNLHDGQTLALDTDHLGYSALGNIDPDINILLDNNTMNCK